MTCRYSRSFVTALALVVFASAGTIGNAASSNFGGNARGAPTGPTSGPSVGRGGTPLSYVAPEQVRRWVPRPNHKDKDGCQLQKWKYWDGEAYYYRIRRHCLDAG